MDNTLDIVVTLVNETNAGMAEINAHLAEMQAASEKANASNTSLGKTIKDTGSEMSSMGTKMTMGVTLPIVGVGLAAADVAMKFQASMALLQTQAGMSAKDVANLSEQVLNLAKTSAFTPQQLSEGLYHLASVGMDAKDAINALTAAQKLAAVGNANMEDSTQAVTIAWKSGISGASDFNDAVASINAIVGAGDMRMQQLNTSLGTSGLESVARSAGLSFSDMGSALALMTDMTGNADVSAQHLRTAFLMMIKPSGAAADALETIGIKSTQLGVDMQEGGLPKALEDIKAHLTSAFGPTALTTLKIYSDILAKDGPAAADKFANSSENAAAVISKAFGGSKSAGTIMQLVSNLDQLNQKEKQVKEGAAKFNEDYAVTTETAAFKVKNAWAKISADLVTLGALILPKLTIVLGQVVEGIQHLVDWFEKLSPGQKKMVEFGVLFVALIGPIMTAIGAVFGFIAAVIAIGAPVWVAIGVVMVLAGTAAALMTWWGPVSGFFRNMWNVIASIFTSQTGFFGSIGAQLVGALLGPFLAIPLQIGRILNSIGPVKMALHDLHIPGFANGVQNFSGGLAMVGEEGPELVSLPTGSSVYPTGTGPSGGKGGSGSTTNIYGDIHLGDQSAVQEFFKRIGRNQELAAAGLSTVGM